MKAKNSFSVKKTRNAKFLQIKFSVFILCTFFFFNMQGQNNPVLNFTVLNTAPINIGDTVFVQNTSIGFTQQTSFVWNDGKMCYFPINIDTAFNPALCNDTIIGQTQIMKFVYYQTKPFYVTLNATDTAGNFYSNGKYVIVGPICTDGNMSCENYVSNGMFDHIDFCPEFGGKLGSYYNSANGQWIYEASSCWYATNNICTPDLFLTTNCILPNGTPISLNDLPGNIFYCELDHSTNALLPGCANVITGYSPNWQTNTGREYIQQKLSTPLSAGAYDVSFWVSLSDWVNYASNIGMLISDTPPLYFPNPNWDVLDATPSISAISQLGGVVTNANGWTQIKGVFNAVGGEEFVTLGNFGINSYLTYNGITNGQCPPTQPPFELCHYLIDDVVITKHLDVSATITQNCQPFLGSIDLAVSGLNGPYTFLWSNGAVTQDIFNLIGGTYTVTVTDAFGCDRHFQYIVKTSTAPAPLVINGSHNLCKFDPLIYVDNYDPTLTYTYLTSLNTTGSTHTDYFNFYPTGGWVTYTATNADGCSTSATFYVYPCCDGDIDLSGLTASQVIANPPSGITIQSGVIPMIQTLPGVVIYINNDFTVDVPIGFDHIDIVFAPDVKVIVNQQQQFVITGYSHLHTCNHDYMWRGIELGDFASIDINHALIEESQFSVYTSKGTITTGAGAIFNGNYISIFVENVCYGPPLPFSVSSTVFESNNLTNGALLTLIPPYQGLMPLCGIKFKNVCNYKIGEEDESIASKVNIFKNVNCGIYLNNSSSIIYNCKFEDIQKYDYAGTGIAIEATTGSPTMIVNIGDMDVSNLKKSNSFTRCRIGIHAHHSTSLTAGFNTFTDMRNTLGTFDAGITETAIQVNNINQNYIRITDNTFTNFETGVKVGTYNNCDIHIINNTFNSTVLPPLNEAAHGVLINNPFTLSPQPLPLNIKNNYFKHCRNGVHLNVCDFADVDNNIITFYDADVTGPNANLTRYGIRASGGFGLHTINHNWIRKPGNTPTPNLRSKLYGINVQTTENNFVQNNLVEKTGTGIRFFNTTLLNTLACNNMDGNRIGLRLENANIGNQGSTITAQDNVWANIAFDIEGLGNLFLTNFFARSNLLPWTPDPIFINQPPFYPFPFGGINPNCDIFHPQPLRDQILGIVNQDGDFNLLTPDEQYFANQAAFQKLDTDSTMMHKGDTDDAVLQNYHDSIATTNLGQLANGANLNSTNLSNISPTNNAEENVKTLLEIYAVTWAVDIFDFTIEQFDALNNIASQNPIMGGNAVYFARGMLHTFYDDDMLVNGKLIHSIRAINLMPYKKGKLYPNPANDFAYYSIRLKKDETCSVQLIDLSGKILSSASNKNENCLVPIAITNLLQGIYCVRILINGMIFENHKLVKQ